jgi:glycosyltransferase involved in cell wall biosynthesis
VGSLRSLKNHVAVIRALSRAGRPEIKLTIVGGGHGETLLRREIDGSGMARQVELTGQLSRDETLRRLWQADAFISLSQGEGLPIAVLEAMACHCPVILSDIPPHREVAGQCEGAWLVNGEELNAIVERIRCLLTLTPKRRVECGNACRRRVEARFSLARTLDQYEQLYRSMNSRRDGEMVTRRHENAQKAEGRVVASP